MNYIGTTEFTLEVKAEGLRRGMDPNHPAFEGRFGRRVVNLIVDGCVPSVRIRNRMYVDRAMAPLAADLLGLKPAVLAAA